MRFMSLYREILFSPQMICITVQSKADNSYVVNAPTAIFITHYENQRMMAYSMLSHSVEFFETRTKQHQHNNRIEKYNNKLFVTIVMFTNNNVYVDSFILTEPNCRNTIELFLVWNF